MLTNETNNEQNVEKINNAESEELSLKETDSLQAGKEIKIELPNMEELSRSINRLSARITNNEVQEENEDMYIGGNKGTRYISDNKNNKLSDLEIFRRCLKQVKNYEQKHGSKAPVPPKFISFLEDYVRAVGSGAMSGEEYKRNNIYREMPLEQINNLK